MLLEMGVMLSEEMDYKVTLNNEMMEMKLVVMGDQMYAKLSQCINELEDLIQHKIHALNVLMELLLTMISQTDKLSVEMV